MPLARNTLPVCAFGAGGSGEGLISLPGIEAALIHVDKGLVTGAEDGTRQNPYHTVAQGLAAAAAVAAAGNPAVCLVYPGEYAEDGLIMGTDYVSLVGVGGRDAVRIEGSTQIVLTVTSELTAVWGVTIAQSLANTDIVNITTGTATRCEFHECRFETPYGTTGSQPVRVNDGGALFKDCVFFHGHMYWVAHRTIFETGASANNDVVLDECQITGAMTIDESIIRIEHCIISADSNIAAILSTTGGEFYFRHNTVVASGDCLEFQSQPNVAVIHDNYLQGSTPGYDINATLAVTGFDIAGNIMYRGMHGNISHVDPIKYVAVAGNPRMDFYQTLQDALDSCTFDDCVVKLLDNLTLTAALTWNKTLRVTIDGNSFHQINRSDNQLLLLGGGAYGGRHVVFRDARLLGYISASVTAAQVQSVRIERCEMGGGVYAGTGNAFTLEIVRSFVYGTAGVSAQWPIVINGVDATVLVKRSRLKGYAGGAGRPAIYYTQQNDLIKIEHSAIWHGAGAANLPIDRSAAQTPSYCSHHDAYNTDPLAGGWLTNLIAVAQRFNTYDVQSDY